jgi:hypothetical protein
MAKTPSEKALYRWTRDLHLCLGLFVSPFVIAFAVSVFFLNHAKVDPAVAASVVTIRDVTIPAGLDVARGREAAERARELVNQAGLTGEIGFVRYVRSEQRVVIPVSRPGLEATVDVDLARRVAVISQRPTGLLESVAYLHKMPGPHNADLRGNWFWIRLWRWLADWTVYALLFISASGLYLWFAIKAERRVGLALIAAGAVCFAAYVYVLAV